MNCQEARDESKTFHYTWLLISIILVTRDLPEDNQFPPMDKGLSEAAQFASLWAIKYYAWVTETKVLWVLMEASLCMAINQKL